jgi:hypothetical protein
MSGTKVLLLRDAPRDQLAKGEVGRVVLAYPNGIVEVEFFDGAGVRRALLTLKPGEFRPVT